MVTLCIFCTNRDLNISGSLYYIDIDLTRNPAPYAKTAQQGFEDFFLMLIDKDLNVGIDCKDAVGLTVNACG
ncbi:hypothetical protein [Okeania sp. SIO1I7]|uniref:hypothetical protein n=1 Tax=Okeania sp. SIO1I7 TaxID=2607772 RepID=UPI0013FA7156|nr:hypothetical protein [Okeania sp. SIO1I7]NET24685.1 hypothetical protein [Okeania sp. SIO1I7]